MAYTKQTWTNDESAVLDTKMTHIEDGIYDNSLATDKINPSGTATTTAEIEEGQITDVIGFKSLKLKGQTSQYTTTGKNLLENTATSGSSNGITYTANNDGTIKVNGTATADVSFYITGSLTLESGSYILSGCPSGGNSNTYSMVLEGVARDVGSGKTFTSVTNKKVAIEIKSGTTCNNLIFKPMIETGSSVTSYEPYTGGKASPNPDFPQDVNNVSGDNIIAINGSKNLFDKDINIVTPGYLNANGAVVTSDATLSYQDRFIKVQPSTAYTISSGTNTIYRIAEYTSDKTFITRVLNANASRSYTFATSSQTHYIKMAGTLTTVLNTLQIEKGNTATSYVAHQGNNFEINLGKNLIQDETFVQGSYLDNTSTTRISCRNAKLKANTTYTFSSTLNYSNFNVAIVTSPNQFPLPNNTSVRYDSGWKNANFTFTTGSDDVYVNIAVKKLPEGVTITPNDVAGIKLQIEKGANATNYASFFTPIEICKIGTYQDYIFKKDGKWFKHKEVGKVILDGVNYKASTKSGTTANIMYTTNNIPGIKPVANNGTLGNLMTSHFKNTTTDIIYSGDVIGIGQRTNEQVSIGLGLSSTLTTLELFNTWLTNNNVDVYYSLATPIDEEITYAPLLRQLDELYNSGLYDNTNISQDNSSEAFILDLEACKNNINGIVEYIRR